MTLSQLDPSEKAPCTRTTFLPARSGSDAAYAVAADNRQPATASDNDHFFISVFKAVPR
jgi:hypothetical protein